MADVCASKQEVVFAWLEKYSGESVDDITSLKTGVVLCKAINGVRPGTIKNISNYKAAFRQMQNIDNFIKVADKLGVTGKDKCCAEDLFYQNNIPKFILTATLFINACAAKFGTDPISDDGVDDLRAFASGAKVEGGKMRANYTGLGIFDSNAGKHQKLASEEARTKDRLVKEDMQDAVASAHLGLIGADQVTKQTMISKAKSSGQDLIIRSKEEAVATSDLGFIGSDQVTKQQMISKAKASGQDLIIRSKEEAVATADLGMFGSDQVAKQKMINEAKSSGQDLIIRSKEEAVATADLGMFGSDQVTKQTMISEAKSSGQDLIIRSKEEAEATADLGMFGNDQMEKQKMYNENNKLDLIIKDQGTSGGDDGDDISFD